MMWIYWKGLIVDVLVYYVNDWADLQVFSLIFLSFVLMQETRIQ